jgi:lycopene cyclase domain-containing protein
MYTYLLLNIGTFLGPLILSFDQKVAYFRRWKALFPSILLTAFVFIVWDVWFTEMGIWSFNPDYLVGIDLLGLPIEEWMFFFTVPYACVFIYDCVKAYFPQDWLAPYAQAIGWGLIGILLAVAVFYIDHWYTAVTFISLAVLLFLNVQFWKPAYLGQFFVSYLIAIVPFLMVNGVLTYLPVVQYNDLENLGIRLVSIPLDDTMYCMLLLLMNVNWYEYFQNRFARQHLHAEPGQV